MAIPISEIVSDVDLAFNIGIGMGFFLGIVLGICIYILYKDYKNLKTIH